jgi:aspartate aminotransferase-like enzyme
MRLFTPGPVDISAEARRAMGAPMMHHRSAEFEGVVKDIGTCLKEVFQTENEVLTLTSSGTGAMEAVVANLLEAGDQALVPVNGKFSKRWCEICRAFGVEAVEVRLEPGESPDADLIAAAVERAGAVDAVLLTHCETSTGSLTDLEAVCRAVDDIGRRRGSRIPVCADCTSSLCIDRLCQDAWGVDCAIGVSQKGVLSPPGLAFVSLNRESVARLREVKTPRYYFDLRRYYEHPTRIPFTPAVSVACAVRGSLLRITELGLERVWASAGAAAEAIRVLVEAAGLRPVARAPSNAVVAFWVDDLDSGRVAELLRTAHGVVVACGQQELSGRVLRVSAIGKTREDILRLGQAFEATMRELGRPFTLDDIGENLEGILEGYRLWE